MTGKPIDRLKRLKLKRYLGLGGLLLCSINKIFNIIYVIWQNVIQEDAFG